MQGFHTKNFYLQQRIYLLFIFSFFVFNACSQDEEKEILWLEGTVPSIHYTWDNPDISFFDCIWDKVPHAAFTDLIEYNNRYYCCFREANNHLPKSKSEYGRIRILESADGVNWYSVAVVRDYNYDLRDPKLSITLDNRLMLLMGAIELSPNCVFRDTKVSFSYLEEEDKENSQILFTDPTNINIGLDAYWLWRVVWKDAIGYGVAYDGYGKDAPYLVKTKNGIDYEIVTRLEGIQDSNESDIHFSGEKMTIIIRNNNSNGYLGTSMPPYTSWIWTGLNMVLHSPKFVALNDELFVSGRKGTGGLNVLYGIRNGSLSLLYTFPGAGDSAYPGAIQVGDELWISYYTTSNRTSIYLAKIPVKNILKKIEE